MPTPMARIALVNNADEVVKLRIKTEDNVGWFFLGRDTEAETPDVFVEPHDAGSWDAVMEPGRVYGFVTQKTAQVPQHPKVDVYAGNGKDPWPKPPPPPPPFYKAVPDFKTRFEAFLKELPVDAEPGLPVHVTHEGEIITISPAHRSRTT